MAKAAAADAPLTLYNWPTSTCSQKVRLVLAEKALPFEDRRLDSRRSENLSDWYLKLNENGVVPTLTHGDRVIIDSSVITEYLDEVFPQVPLRPADVYQRARMRSWRQFIDEVPTPAIRVPSYNRYIRHKWQGMAQDQFDALVERRTVRKHFYRRMGRDGSDAEDEREAIEKLRETVLRMDRALADGPWIIGEQFTLADVAPDSDHRADGRYPAWPICGTIGRGSPPGSNARSSGRRLKKPSILVRATGRRVASGRRMAGVLT